jgi:excisionase family DNA binding protein
MASRRVKYTLNMVQSVSRTVEDSRAAGALLSPDEAGELLGVSAQTVRRRIRDGQLYAHRLGDGPKARLRIDTADLARFVAANDREPQ